MSLPARSGTQMSAIADVRVNRGSTWMTVAPRSRASITQWKPTGWFSAIDDPMIRMASALARSCCAVVAPPRPNEVPRPGTVELCHIRAWLLTATMPRPAAEQLLDQVVLFVVERRAAEVGDVRRTASAAGRRASPRTPRSRVAQTRSATMSIARSRSSLLPLASRTARGTSPASARRAMREQFEAGRALRAEMPARDRRSRIPLDRDQPLPSR